MRKTISQWFQYIYFLRFSLLAWLFLVFLVCLDDRTGAAALTRGIMTVESGWQAFFAAFFLVALQMTVLITARNIVKNGEDRFLSTPPFFLHAALTSVKTKTVWLVLAVVHIPTYLALVYLAFNASREQQTFTLFGESTQYVWFFLFLGVAAALLFWYLVSLFYAWTYKPSIVEPAALIFPQQLFGDTALAAHPPRIQWLEAPFFFLRWSCAGYAKSDKDPFWELHHSGSFTFSPCSRSSDSSSFIFFFIRLQLQSFVASRSTPEASSHWSSLPHSSTPSRTQKRQAANGVLVSSVPSR